MANSLCLQAGEKVVMRQKEAFYSAVKDDDLYVFVGFECGDDLIQFWNRLGAKDIQRRVVKRDAPVR
jgi:hypothetical protein